MDLDHPRGNSSSVYFPLRRAANDSQYILGRTFLQSAHLIADYDRNIFNLSQALFPPSNVANVIAITPPQNSNTTNPGGGPTRTPSLSVGAIVGIAVGGVVVSIRLYINCSATPPKKYS